MTTAIVDYGNGDVASNFDAKDMAEYFMEAIDEFHTESQDVILETYNNLMICPHCQEIIGTGGDWTPNYCKECGKQLTGGNQIPIK